MTFAFLRKKNNFNNLYSFLQMEWIGIRKLKLLGKNIPKLLNSGRMAYVCCCYYASFFFYFIYTLFVMYHKSFAAIRIYLPEIIEKNPYFIQGTKLRFEVQIFQFIYVFNDKPYMWDIMLIIICFYKKNVSFLCLYW